MTIDEKLDKWQEQLLDVGKRNQLINFRESKLRTVPIFGRSIYDVFEKLMNEDQGRIYGPLEFFDIDQYAEEYIDGQVHYTHNLGQRTKINVEDIINSALYSKNFKSRMIIGSKLPDELNKTLKSLKRLSETSLLERGINSLYLAFGFIKWNDIDGSEYLSPLLLVPVSLENEGAFEPYHLSLYEEEVVTNPTLIYKFSNDLKIDIPEFRHDNPNELLNTYFNNVRKLMEKYGFELYEEMQLGFFSFLKMAMYDDIKENREEIVNNIAIRKILDEEIDDTQNTPVDIDKYFKNGEEIHLHNVVDADSSQINAIVQAMNGSDLVIQGPPGTGKSQTITNLIAEYLYQGKKVLFVSEKLAALEVVYGNLAKAGLSSFCLELHSHKANKLDVVKDIYETVANSTSITKTNKADDELEKLKKAKLQLDEYVNVMHTPVDNLGLTPYELLTVISSYKDIPPVEYEIVDISRKGKEYFDNSIGAISGYVNSLQYLDEYSADYHKHPWYGFRGDDINFEERKALKNDINLLDSVFDDLGEECNKISRLGPLTLETITNVKSSIKIMQIFASIKYYTSGFFDDTTGNKIQKMLNTLVELKTREQSLYLSISNTFIDEIFNEGNEKLKEYFDTLKNHKFSLSHSYNRNYKQVLSSIRSFQKNPKYKASKKTYLFFITSVIEDIEIKGAIEKINIEISDLFDTSKDESDPQTVIESYLNWWNMIKENATPLEIEAFSHFSDEQFREFQASVKNFLSWYEQNADKLEMLNRIQNYFDSDLINFNEISISLLRQKIRSLNINFYSLSRWNRFSIALASLDENNSRDFVDSSIKENIPSNLLCKSFELLYYTQWRDYIYETVPVLLKFSRASQDEAVKLFKEKDCLCLGISEIEINEKVRSNYPNTYIDNRPNTEMSVLSREYNKTRRIKPVRQLLQECGRLIQRVKPCFMMSPLSVSTYLDADSCLFDVVIFDEASQIFPWDAVGAIYRSKQVIVAGDSKQMPPSKYFIAELEVDDIDDDDSTMDFESLLDICSASFYCLSLNWHYRSRTEDLIRYSNRNFYDNNLVTFPSAYVKTNDYGVEFYYVSNGIYDRSKGQNEVEAKKVADLVFEHFKNHPKRSLGVVAFSIKQQEAIEDAINNRREKDPSFDKYFSYNQKEPFFVKNLETVQGDERDTIIFSIAYGYDKDHKFILNFGPLSKQGGERRLNVAVTRAKMNVKVVSSIKYTDIDLSRTSSLGTALLHDYLEYAEKGPVEELPKPVVDVDDEEIENRIIAEHSFEDEICDVLKEAGYEFDQNIGSSSYKIDIAIKYPGKDIYVLAVECDGDMYYSGKTTRDRDRLRQEVLEKLGWKFYRIWSSEWSLNKEKEKKKLLDSVREAISSHKDILISEFESNIAKVDKQLRDIKKALDSAEIVDSDYVEAKEIDYFESSEELLSLFPAYKPYNFNRPAANVSYSNRTAQTYIDFIEDVVKFEGPIKKERMLKYFAHFIGRRYAKLTYDDECFFAQYRRASHVVYVEDAYTLNTEIKPLPLRVYKIKYEGKILPYSERKANEIPRVELMGGLLELIKYLGGETLDGLASYIAYLLGYQKTSGQLKIACELALEKLEQIDPHVVVKEGGQIIYKE